MAKRVTKKGKEIRELEFQRGLNEWSNWITSDKSVGSISKRIRQSSDDDEKAYFRGVLTGRKRAGYEPQTTPTRTWKRPEPQPIKPRPPGQMPRMSRSKEEVEKIKKKYHVDGYRDIF